MASEQTAYEAIRTFWNNRPCGSRNSNKLALTREYFDEIESNRYYVEPHVPEFAQFEKWSGKKVLEIGCGIGTDSINFARAGAEITVVDFSEVSLDMCRKRFELYNLKGNFYHGNAELLTTFLPLDKYDLIYSFGVIHHTLHPKRIIQQLTAYIKPETELRIMVYSAVSWKLFWMMFEYGPVAMTDANRLIATYSESQTGCPTTYTYTFDEVSELLSPWFNISKIWKDHIFTWNVSDYIERKYTVDKYWLRAPQSLIDKYAKELGWHTLVVAHPSNITFNDPTIDTKFLGTDKDDKLSKNE